MTPPDFFAAIVGHAALKGTVVLLLALAFIGRLASARQRHFTWHLTFLALLALPLLAHLTPAYHPAIPEGTLRLMPQGLAAPPTSEPAKPTSGAVPSPAAAPDVVPRTAPLPLTDWLLWCWTIGALPHRHSCW